MATSTRYTPGIGQSLVILAVSLTLFQGGSCLHTERPYETHAQEVMQAVLRRGHAVHTLRAEARLTYHAPADGQVTATLRLMAQRGGSLRLDLVTPLDTPLITVVTHEGHFSLIDARTNQHAYGPASPCNLARVLGVALSPDDVLTILSGSAPLIPFDDLELAWDGRAMEEVLTLRGAQQTQRLRLDGDQRRWDLKHAVITEEGDRETLAIEAWGYRVISALRLPQDIRVTQDDPPRQLTLRFRRSEINLDLPATAFAPLDAGGLPSRVVDCPEGSE